MRICSIFLIVTGVLLIALAPLWPRIASSSVFWDETEAEEYSASVTEMHHANTEAVLNQTKTKQVAAARERFQRNQAKLNRARQFRERGGRIMRWIGGITAIIGLGLYQTTRPRDD